MDRDTGIDLRGALTEASQADASETSLAMPGAGLDIEKYRHHVDHLDISEDQKVDLLRTVWRILESFADRAFGLHPAQQSCGKQGHKTLFQNGKGLQSAHQSTDPEDTRAPNSSAPNRRSP